MLPTERCVYNIVCRPTKLNAFTRPCFFHSNVEKYLLKCAFRPHFCSSSLFAGRFCRSLMRRQALALLHRACRAGWHPCWPLHRNDRDGATLPLRQFAETFSDSVSFEFWRVILNIKSKCAKKRERTLYGGDVGLYCTGR